MNDDPLKNIICRNLNEVGEALYYLNALIGMSDAQKENNILFLRLASDALKNDMMSHLMRVLDSAWQKTRLSSRIPFFAAQASASGSCILTRLVAVEPRK